MPSFTDLHWTRAPKDYEITDESIVIKTEPNTDLWQRTYYGFRNDNAPVLQMTTTETYFSFTVRTDFNTKRRFDQCGVVIYLDSDNWLKASIEYENDTFQRLGSVVTNNGYSDWSSFDITSDITSMWYRLSRRESDYCIEYSEDGKDFKQMRICHLNEGHGEIQFGIYACSPEASSFVAEFTHMNVGPCQWEPHV
ncbi:DUF1349 domain-containing protein [Macrococcoides goetzii]|uniref:DUF1349 domain-containing protein n=1 Tax=Macrococcoides goetzii TaxID=1891097 RepID=A0A395GAS6_9STAP|nr:DUF1349 domain-containing protein [Macrococcus goetzii]RAI81116.1 DUF1349 domain-containing protein [Macrococcus goetzii]